MTFYFSQVIHVLSTVDDLLSMCDHPYTINSSTGYDGEEGKEYEFIKFTFPLRNGVSHIKMYEFGGFIVYENKSGEVLETIEFNDKNLVAMNSSFKKGFKQIREFDRQNVIDISQTTQSTIDRASFGLAEVN